MGSGKAMFQLSGLSLGLAAGTVRLGFGVWKLTFPASAPPCVIGTLAQVTAARTVS